MLDNVVGQLLQRIAEPRPLIMGVLNVTPDSFSDGGSLWVDNVLQRDLALRRVEAMLAEGAELIDIGGESTRPGAAAVSVDEELARVIPVLEAVVSGFACAVSVDTSTPQVMTEAASAGAAMINDVRALRRDGALEVAASTGLPVCLMHMQGEPGTMQDKPEYDDVVASVEAFLLERQHACEQAGIGRSHLLFDPGFGFGKTVAQNYTLFRTLPRLASHGLPLLVGVSRKSMIGAITHRALEQRVTGSAVLAALAAQRGARILRVHDVAETADALRLLNAVENNW